MKNRVTVPSQARSCARNAVARGEASDWVHDRDVKWSKIAILKEIADRALFHGEGRAYREDPRFAVLVPPKLPSGDRARRLLVFLDADAAVSNFERTFEWQALHRESKNPGGGWAGAEEVLALLCAEGDGGSVANTGVIVARDTPETVELLERWWAVGVTHPSTLYGLRHEQSALDVLLRENPALRSRIGIAASGAFNTAPPFYRTHTLDAFILHLMFEPYGGLRTKVFAELEACLNDGRLDPAAILDFVARLPALADAAYAQGMRETTNDENLAVMYAQLLWMVHGKARARDALELYSKAVEFAPHDADTYRILGTETISMLGEVGEDGGSRWCQVISLFETSVSLERNPTRLPQVQALLQKARAKCAEAGGDHRHDSLAPHWWTTSMLAACAAAVLLLVLGPVGCSLLSAHVKEKYD